MFLNPAVQANGNPEKEYRYPPLCAEKKVGIKDKISNKFKTLKKKVSSLDAKTVAKKAALAPFKACWWVLKYELIAAGVLVANTCVVVPAGYAILFSYCKSIYYRCEPAIEKLEKSKKNPPEGCTADDIQDLITYLQSLQDCVDRVFHISTDRLHYIEESTQYFPCLITYIFKFSNSTILKHIENNDIIAALKAFNEAAMNMQSPGNNAAVVHTWAFDAFETAIDSILKETDPRTRLDMVTRKDGLNDSFKLIVVRCDGKQDSIGGIEEFIFDGDVNLSQIAQIFKKLQTLNASVCQDTATQNLVAQFNLIYKAAKTAAKSKPQSEIPTMD